MHYVWNIGETGSRLQRCADRRCQKGVSNLEMSPKTESIEVFWCATAERGGIGKWWKDEVPPGDASEVAVFPQAGEGLPKGAGGIGPAIPAHSV